jgi:ring-1,2-phenylacetyl-CoA epoxidase subunit PaaE
MTARHAVFHPLRVSDIDRLTDDAVALTFEVPDDLREEYAFTQGQHLTVRTPLAGDDVRRNYSICSPAGEGTLRIAVKRLSGGAFSSYAIERLQPGDTLEVMTPTGRFFTQLDPENAKHYCCIAAGSGITPMLSILSTVLSVEPGSRVTLLFANQTTKTIMFLEELEDLKDRYRERFHLVHVLTREPADVELFSGRIDGERLRLFLDTIIPADSVDEWFLCGPFPMITGLRATLKDAGVDRSHVHTELFHVESTPPVRRSPDLADDSGGSDVTIVLDGRRSRLRLHTDDVPVLEAALGVRSDAPYACKGGVCGTCRAKLLEGTVQMDQNWALEAAEVAKGYVLTCQSHPTSDSVLLDYDA